MEGGIDLKKLRSEAEAATCNAKPCAASRLPLPASPDVCAVHLPPTHSSPYDCSIALLQNPVASVAHAPQNPLFCSTEHRDSLIGAILGSVMRFSRLP